MTLAKHHINGNVNFHFYGNLLHFLPKRSNGIITYSADFSVSVKDAIEAIGIPHVEIGQLLKNKIDICFTYQIKAGDKIEVYPQTGGFLELNQSHLRPPLSYPLRFILDVHLGRLARLLRLTGFDSHYKTSADDVTIAKIAEAQNRIVLTRDIGLLKHKIINWGYWVRSQYVKEQFVEVANRFDLWSSFKPFTYCLACNGEIRSVKKEEIYSKLPSNTALYYHIFFQCCNCSRIYWKGSHYDKMLQTLEYIKNLKSA